MAAKRMFSIDVIDTDRFLDMPVTTQALYFHLGMRADDDGFVSSPKKIIKIVNCTNDDMRILISKGYVISFESGVIVITDWKANNSIRGDRYKPTTCRDEKELLEVRNDSYVIKSIGIPSDNQLDTDCIPTGTELEPQVRLGKDRLGKDRLDREVDKVVVSDLPYTDIPTTVKPTTRNRIPKNSEAEYSPFSVSEKIGIRACENPSISERNSNNINNNNINNNNNKERYEQPEVANSLNSPKRNSRFIPPTAEEVREYCVEHNYSVDPQRFVDFYECKGWMVGKNKMKDWKAAVRTWARRDQKEVTKDEPEPTNSVRLW